VFGIENGQFRAIITCTGWLNTGPDATPLEKYVVAYANALAEAYASSSQKKKEAALQRSILIQAMARHLLCREGLM